MHPQSPRSLLGALGLVASVALIALTSLVASCASAGMDSKQTTANTASSSSSGSSSSTMSSSSSSSSSSSTATTMDPLAAFKSKIKHIVVIYQENWSFDGLYGSFPGAEGIANASGDSLIQKAKDGSVLETAPVPVNGKNADPNFASLDPKTFLKPYDLTNLIKPEVITGDLVHRFYTNQLQIDGGKNDKFVAWSDNGGLVMSHFDATNMPEGKLAQQYTLFDHFFQGAFGGSFLNHQFLIAAAAPTFPNAPASVVGTKPDAAGLTVNDAMVNPDGYVVNTAYSVNSPTPAF